MPHIHIFQRRHLPSLLLVLFLAAFIRLHQIKTSDYTWDNSALSVMTLDVVHGGDFPTKGLTSSKGIFHPPTMLFLMAIPYAVTTHPFFATVFVVFLNFFAVAALYAIAYRYFSPTAALVGGLAFALNPWALLNGRTIWNPSLLMPFLVLGMWLCLHGFLEGKRWAQTLGILAFFLGLQFHFPPASLVPLPFIIMGLGRKNLSWRAVGAGFALVLLTLLPYILGFSAKDRDAISRFFESDDGAEREWSINWEAPRRLVNLAMGAHIENQMTDDYQTDTFLDATSPRPLFLWAGLAGLALLGMATVWFKNRGLGLVIVSWAWLVIIGTGLGLVYPLYHYLTCSLPALFLLIGIGAEWLLTHLPARRYAQTVFYGMFAAILLTQGLWWNRALHYADQQHMGGYFVPLHYYLPIRQKLLDYEDVLILGGGLGTNWWLWKPLAYEADCVRDLIVPNGSVAVFPDHPFAVVYPTDGQGNLGDGLMRQMYTAGKLTEYPLRSGETPTRIFEYDQPPAWLGPDMNSLETLRFENGAQLIGYALAPNRVYIEWRVLPEQSDGLNYQYFVHFLDANGQKISQLDAGFYASNYWCEGDRLILWSDVSIPPETVELHVGMYRLLDEGGYRNANLVDSVGNPAGQTVEFGLPQ